MTRGDVLNILARRIPVPKSRDEQIAECQAALLFAATVANAMSDQSVGMSINHVEETANAMAAVLEETFGIELGSE